MADSDVAVSVGDQLPMLLKNSAYTVDANLQKHTRAPPRTRSGRFQSMLSVRRATPLLVRRLITVLLTEKHVIVLFQNIRRQQILSWVVLHNL